MRPISASCVFALVVVMCSAIAGQQTSSLDQVKCIYVGSFGDKPDSSKLRHDLITELNKHRRLTVVDSPGAAEAVLKGSGEVWIKGYYSLNPRIREVGEGALPIYGGFLSVELTGRQAEPLWSWLVTPRRTGSGDIRRELAGEIAKRLDDAMASSSARR